ncbi:retrotransposon protein, putative, ty1-copia subclass [Tanacetum coccineum]
MLEREKLSGTNFSDWFRQLRIVLRVEKKLFTIEQPIPPTPVADATNQELEDWNKIYDIHNEVACFMLGGMSPEHQRQFENYSLYDMFQELKSIFEKQDEVESYVEQLERLSYVLSQDISVGLILNGLTNDFVGFVMNYKMHNMGKTIGELHALLIEYEMGLPKKTATPQVLAIQGSRIQKLSKKPKAAKGMDKGKGKGKNKLVYAPNHKIPKPTAKEHSTKDDAFHHCKEVGHRRRNCHVYLAELMKKNKQAGTASTSGERKLKQGAIYLYMGNGVGVQVEAIGSFDLAFPNGLVICLDNCHYAPTIIRCVVLVSHLVDNGFIQSFTDYGMSVSINDVLYFNVILRDDIYEINMFNLMINVNFIYNVSNKRSEHNLDYTYLWHYHLAHISKKRIKKLQHDGLLKSTDSESFDQCVSCLSGKMTRKPFPHQTKRATDLLRLIHTNVCGSLRHLTRQGASYFITFTDGFSRYGYFYFFR